MRRGSDIPRLEQRNGVYNIVWTEATHIGADGRKTPARSRRLGLRTRDPNEAKARFAAFLLEGEAFARRDRPPELTVADALDDYFKEHVRQKCADWVRQENAIRHLKEAFAEKPLSEIDIPQCRQYANLRRAGAIGGGARRGGDLKKGSDSTIRRELVVLRAAANHAIRWKRLVGPMPTFEMPMERDSGEDVKWLTRDELENLFIVAEVISMPLYRFMTLAYWWGARRGWVERLHVSQVDLAHGRVNPYKPEERVTNKRRRILPVFDELRPSLTALVRETRDGFLFGPRTDFYRPFRELCEAAGLGERSNPHILRHSRATHMLMAGESIYKVARLLGDSVQTVERVYGHHSAEYLMERTG